MERKLAFLLALLIMAALAACGEANRPITEPDPTPSLSESAPAPETVPESSSAPEDISSAVSSPESSQPEPAKPEIDAAPGVEVKTLLTWRPGQTDVSIPLPARGGRVLVEVREKGSGKLLGFNLASGEQAAQFSLTDQSKSNRNEVRQVLDAADWEIKVFNADSYQHSFWTHGLGGYHLPDALKEGRQRYRCGFDWDAQPEKDLLTWTDPDGLWLANARGENRRLLLATEEMGPYLEQWEMTQDYKSLLADDLPEGERIAFLSPRLINNGRTVAVDFGQWGNQMGHNGLAVVDIASAKTDWYREYVVMTADNHEYLDDTHILMGNTKIDVTTGEISQAYRWTTAPLCTGDFIHYFGWVDQEDGGIDLFTCTLEDWQTAEPFLKAKGYQYLYLFENSVVDDRQLICKYETATEEGLLLVTLPEDSLK